MLHSQPNVDLFLLEARQNKGQNALEAQLTREYLWTNYEHYNQVFTDVSKDARKGQVWVCIHHPKERKKGNQIKFQCLQENY